MDGGALNKDQMDWYNLVPDVLSREKV